MDKSEQKIKTKQEKISSEIDDFSHICRTCLLQSKSKNLILMSEIFLLQGEVKLMDVLMKYTSIEDNEHFPQKICFNCIAKAEEAYCFFEKCNKSHIIFNQLMSMHINEKDQKEFDIDVGESRFKTTEDPKFEIITLRNDDHEDVEIKIILDDSFGNTDDHNIIQTDMNEQEDSSDGIVATTSDYLPDTVCEFCQMKLNLDEIEHHQISLGHFKSSSCFSCPFCELKLFSEYTFKNHLRFHYAEKLKKYVCELCGYEFKWARNHHNHMKIHGVKEEEKIMCPDCGLLLANSTSLKVHRKRKHAEIVADSVDEWKCEFCETSFNHILKFKKHLKEKHAAKDFHCIICGKNCEDKRTLYYHEQLHLDKHGIECNFCHKKLLTQDRLLLHLRIHKYVKKKHICSVCDKGFRQLDKLEAHLRVHTGEKPFSCPYCDKAFNHQNNLTHHVRLHTGDTPYKCLFCTKEFSNSHALRKHMNTHPRKSQVPQC